MAAFGYWPGWQPRGGGIATAGNVSSSVVEGSVVDSAEMMCG